MCVGGVCALVCFFFFPEKGRVLHFGGCLLDKYIWDHSYAHEE